MVQKQPLAIGDRLGRFEIRKSELAHDSVPRGNYISIGESLGLQKKHEAGVEGVYLGSESSKRGSGCAIIPKWVGVC